MTNKKLRDSLEKAIKTFQKEARSLISNKSTHAAKAKQQNMDCIQYRLDKLQPHLQDLANQFLFGGYLHVRGFVNGAQVDKKIYLNAIEFYYHECKDKNPDNQRIKDYIMYHIPDETTTPVSMSKSEKELRQWRDNIFPLGTLHAHTSGVDITFEDPKGQFRGSVLIREYIVVENSDFSNLRVEHRSTFLYDELLMGMNIMNGNSISITWQDTNKQPIEKTSAKERVNVQIKELVNGQMVIKNTKDTRPWHFRRTTPLNTSADVPTPVSRVHESFMKALHDDAENIIREYIGKGVEFDSHKFIQEFTRRHQKEYIEALYVLRDCNGPFHELHGHIGVFLSKRSYLEKLGKEDNLNIFGYYSKDIGKWKY